MVSHPNMRRYLCISLIFWAFLMPPGTLFAQEKESCVTCHTSVDLIDELTEELIAKVVKPEISDYQEGKSYTLKQAPYDLFEKVLVEEEFLETVHGKIACSKCHGGNPGTDDIDEAHKGLISDPSFSNLEEACGECHGDILKSARNSLHATPEFSLGSLKMRSSPAQFEKLQKDAIASQCLSCHKNSCGSCHVSRPQVIGGGLTAGHVFKKRPDVMYHCAACHSATVTYDTIGKQSLGDTHFRDARMECTDCHKAGELHASTENIHCRYHLEQKPRCIDCHGNLAQGSIRDHAIHGDKVDCAVCHAQAYQHCASCHMGRDSDGISYYQEKQGAFGLVIGMNTIKGGAAGNAEYVLVRRIPVQPDSFKEYLGGDLENFSALPTFKRTTPHNIQRKTWQNAHCNNCHGRRELFLKKEDVPKGLEKANKKVIVPENRIPKEIKGLAPVEKTLGTINEALAVTPEWLREHLKDENIIIVDARDASSYEEEHIPGAMSLCFCHVRQNHRNNPPYALLSPEELAVLFAEKIGLTPEKQVIVYDTGQLMAGAIFLALERIGHGKVAFLKGNLTAWKRAGFELESGESPEVAPTKYEPRPQDVLAGEEFIKKGLAASRVVVIDARDVAYHMGYAKHEYAGYGGHVPGAVSLPINALMTEDGGLKPMDEVRWLLRTYRLYPDMRATIVTSCNTAQHAAHLYMILRYLGFTDVKVHDGSWLGWTRVVEE